VTGRALVEIFCDGSDSIGYGHIRRSRTLAAHLERSGCEVRLSGLSSASRGLLPAPSIAAAGREPAVTVFDAPAGIDERIRLCSDRGARTVALDWFGAAVPDVNIAIYAHGEVRSKLGSHVGFEYVLIREEIVSVARQSASGKSDRVLIVIGGGDRLGQAHHAARALARMGLQVTLVQGPLARSTKRAEGYEVLVDPPQLPRLLAGCDWVVTNGGGCFFEACCLGKAALVLPQTDAEWKIARYAQDRDAVLGAGFDAVRAYSPLEVARVSDKSARLVDGQGAGRVSAIVMGLL
jgi:spore coat polysaccharide biosynthesis predicted glycosyltransferase SpsG